MLSGLLPYLNTRVAFRFRRRHVAIVMAEDPIWSALREEAEAAAVAEPVLSELAHAAVLDRADLEESVSYRLARKLGHHAVSEDYLQAAFNETMHRCPTIGQEVRNDLEAVKTRDPAADNYFRPFLYFKGFQALTGYRIGHRLYLAGRTELAFYLQSLISEIFAVDIHPAARIGSGILFDHATSIVVGETAVIEDEVSVLHEVTLGGTGKTHGDRHPKVRRGVLIGAGAKLIGNIEVGVGAKIGAGSVVLDNVPPHTTVAGVPAKIVGRAEQENPALAMDHHLSCGDWAI